MRMWWIVVVLVLVCVSGGSGYVVERNVKDYGAVGDGVHDDTPAIILALTVGRGDNSSSVYPNAVYSPSTQRPAYVFFPPGTYLVMDTLPVIYYTQMVGDPTNPPTIKFVRPDVVRVLEVAGNWYHDASQNNFYRQIRNFVIDMTQCPSCTGVHWKVAQATSITNVYFKCAIGSQCQGMWMEEGSGGFFSDVIFEGGVYGMWVGNQQFTTRNVTIRGTSAAAVYLNWDWVWTFIGLHISDTPVGFDINSATGSTLVIDSTFTNTSIAIRTAFGSGVGAAASLVVDNVHYNGNGVIVQNLGENVLTSSGNSTYVHSWVQGHIWQNTKNTVGIMDLSSLTPSRPSSLINPDKTYFQMTRPTYVGVTQVDVTTLGVVGDGVTDNTVALQSALTNNAGTAVLYFPYGTYLIGNTVKVPAGTRMVGQAWSVLMAAGAAFQNASNPIPMLQVGAPGDVGVAQLMDFVVSTQGPQPGAKLVEWNLHDPANSPGSNGLWDFHFRIGGAVGTNIEPSNCPAGDGTNSPASLCSGAWIMLHVTKSANLYLENVWGWTADHDIDQGPQINVYNTRGMLCESQGPTWMYGTAFEHNTLYQYNLYGAQNIFMGAIQTETPYYQPSKTTPFAVTHYTDPAYCQFDLRCNMAYGLSLQSSSSIWIYGTGLYSFFDVWNQTCLAGQPSCQEQMIYNYCSHNIYSYAVSTYGSINMLSGGWSYSLAANNTNTFCATAVVDLNIF